MFLISLQIYIFLTFLILFSPTEMENGVLCGYLDFIELISLDILLFFLLISLCKYYRLAIIIIFTYFLVNLLTEKLKIKFSQECQIDSLVLTRERSRSTEPTITAAAPSPRF